MPSETIAIAGENVKLSFFNWIKLFKTRYMKPKRYFLLFTLAILISCIFYSCDQLGSGKKGMSQVFLLIPPIKKC
jgi:hypothetical protein